MTQWKPIEEFLPAKELNCETCRALIDLSPVERDEARRVLADRTYTHRTVTNWLDANGHTVSLRSVARHRRNECGGMDQ